MKDKKPSAAFSVEEAKRYKLSVTAELNENKTLLEIKQSIEDAIENNYDGRKLDAEVVMIKWQNMSTTSSFEVYIGPVQTTKTFDKLSKKIHVILENYCDLCIDVQNVSCIDSIP